MLLNRKSKCLSVDIVLVAMELNKEKINAGNDQPKICDVAKPREGGMAPPDGQQTDHAHQGQHLTNLHTNIETQFSHQHLPRIVSKGQLLQTGGEAKAMQQPKDKDHLDEAR